MLAVVSNSKICIIQFVTDDVLNCYQTCVNKMMKLFQRLAKRRTAVMHAHNLLKLLHYLFQLCLLCKCYCENAYVTTNQLSHLRVKRNFFLFIHYFVKVGV